MELLSMRTALVQILILQSVLRGLHCAQPRSERLLKKSHWIHSGRRHGKLKSRLLNTVTIPSSRKCDLSQSASGSDVEALTAFKQALDEDSRLALSSWNASDSAASPCGWEGIACCPQSERVVSLELVGMGLAGRMSPLLGRLQELQRIDLSHNALSGEIPTSLFNCTHLAYLALANNTFTGQIPSQIGDSRLRLLDLSNNLYLEGSIPPSLGNCSSLTSISLDNTTIQGEIPQAVGKLSQLEVFSVINTLNNGSVPASLGNCSSLLFLRMGNVFATNYSSELAPPNSFLQSDSQLSGTLPDELGNLRQLQTLFILGTKIEGPVPSWIANLTSISSITLLASRLRGTIPEFFGGLPSLQDLELAENYLSGEIPDTIANCSNLEYLNLAQLNLQGVVPSNLGALPDLTVFYADHNNLEGKIPSTLSNCSALEVLTFGWNPNMDIQPLEPWIGSLKNLKELFLTSINLSGRIPAAIGELSQLEMLILEANYLSGPIDKSLGNCSELQMLLLAENLLAGNIPQELWELRQMRQLHLLDNSFTGSLSAGIANMTYLEELILDENSFQGTIPSQLTQLSRLQIADFWTNHFYGHIPVAIGNLSALQSFTLDFNSISGSIPTSMGNLSDLAKLGLSSNQLTGSIPSDLMKCSQLVTLRLAVNLLEGSIPVKISQLLQLEDLRLQHNRLSGGWPQTLDLCANLRSFGEFSSMTVLQLSANNFSGSIPPELENCQSLQSVDLSANQLNGTIPSTLGNLQYLVLLNLSDNQLEGPLPDTGIFVSGNFSAEWFLGNPKLCGSRLPQNCSVLVSASSCSGLRCSAAKLAVIIPCSAIFGLLIIGVGIYAASWRRRAHQRKNAFDLGIRFLMLTSDVQLSQQDVVQILDPANLIARGGSSCVYRADVERVPIVIKIATLRDETYERLQTAISQMQREACLLAGLRHRNILKLLGMFSTDKMTGLILEFMPMGSLHDQLYHVRPCSLTWERRLDIALGVAHGLVYLHEDTAEPIIHRDLKPQNILLDADMNPKLGDFGISKFSNRMDEMVTASQWCGTVGYIPPEYVKDNRVSTRGDVYSFGMVLLELLTGRRPTAESKDQDGDLQRSGPSSRETSVRSPLVSWVYKCCSAQSSSPLAVVDPSLRDTNENFVDTEVQQMKLLIQVGLLCTQADPQSRPRMHDVMTMLTQIKELRDHQVSIRTVDQLAEESENAA